MTRSNRTRKYMRSPCAGRTPAPTDTVCISFKTAKSPTAICLLTANPTFLPLQYMDQTGTLNREHELDLSRSLFLSHSRAMRRRPCCISLARYDVGTANSRRRNGELRVSSWRQKLTRPFRKPKKVPVTVEASESVERESSSDEGWKPQHGTMHSTSDRKERRNLTSLAQSTDVGVSIMLMRPRWLPKSIIVLISFIPGLLII
ncbi:hypothetical protein HS088_TW11G01081 [Tripterygium wilfordii]|uniref:Uncharacterized protein n=1 Tax=Tripterygium wilfordii TaxID=458696 RepID=A0A7J7D413_TRIWF|nr:hypothetical protein HS088_TW11G01081 [Tripterygium wilfordii]